MAQDNGYQAKPGSGSVFKNDRKEQDWHADWRGKILMPDGTEHYLDVYDNVSKSGVEYRTVRIGNPVANKGEQAPVRNSQPAYQAVSSDHLHESEEDLPF
jgi:hypothetical protein